MLTPEEHSIVQRVHEGPIFQAFIVFIERTKGDDAIPRFRDVDLMSDYKLARNIYILDVHQGTPTFKVRYAGTEICKMLGFEPTGKFLEELKFLEDLNEIKSGYEKIVRERIPYVFLNPITFDEPKMSPFKKGQNFVMARLAFPLLDDDQRIGHIIGVMDFPPNDNFSLKRFFALPYSVIS